MYTLIDTLEDFIFLNDELLTKDYIGVDTEFRRTTKFNMRLALLQINDGEEIYLVDATAFDATFESSSFLDAPSVVKIFHSCKEDIEAVYTWTNRKMNNIFDTQLANAFLNGEFSVGYQALVREKLGIELEKTETRSNWIRRPLSDSQLKYAALDVEYLIYLYQEQKRDLILFNKLDWLYQDIDRLKNSIFNSDLEKADCERSISKSRENNLLARMNEIVIFIAQREKINSTLFFSKKAQKDFLRLALSSGLQEASMELSPWRKDLIISEIKDMLERY